MNGESVFGWLKIAAVFIAVAVFYAALDKVIKFFTVGAGYNNPAKRGVDSVVSTITGREETLGGWLNDVLDPNAKKVAALSKPIGMSAPAVSNEPTVGDIPVDPAAGSLLPAWFARGFFGNK